MKNSKYLWLLSLIASALLFNNCHGYRSLNEISSLSSIDGRFIDTNMNPALMCATTDPGQTVLRRLSNDELANSLKDTLSIAGADTGRLPADVASADGFSNNASFLKSNSVYLYELVNIIESAVNSAMSSNVGIFNCNGNTDGACAIQLIQDFARKAYRRPLKSDEQTLLVSFFTKSQSSGLDFKNAIGVAYQRILLSPHFLFRTSFGRAGSKSEIAVLSPHEYVSRLSYFLWNSPPDERLLNLADQNGLQTAEVVKAEVARMLKDPKALRFNQSFVGQWVGTTGLPNDFAIRTALPLQTQRDMRTETETFVAAIVQGNGSPLDLIGADYSYINENLASHYGISGVSGSQFRKVSLANTSRRGLLTQGAFLTLTSSNERSKPTGRGNTILQNFTCTPPPPFPDGAMITPLDESGSANLSVRQQLDRHTSNPSCAACHREMDPVGLGLENFDQTGRFRTVYTNGFNVEPAGTLRNKSFRDSVELLNILKQEKDFKRCITKKLMTYALGRSLTVADNCALDKIGQTTVQADKTFVDLVVGIVLSEQFRMNRTDSWGEQ